MKKIPVVLVTGFLGAGKTEFLNRILRDKQNEKVAVLMNEFGSVGIDERLLLRTVEEVVEMNNGAICCVDRGDTEKVLLKLVENRDREIDRVVVETTGLANPLPIARLFFEKAALRDRFELDLIVTVVDASNIIEQLQDTPEAKVQIMSADVVLLNKVDLVDDRRISEVRMYIRNISPVVRIFETVKSDIGLDELGGGVGFCGGIADGASAGVAVVGGGSADEAVDETAGVAAAGGCVGFGGGGGQVFVRDIADYGGHEHSHDDEIETFVLRADKPLDMGKVARWIGEMLVLNGKKLMRYKGILDIAGSDDRFVFQGVHMYFENRADRKWEDGEERVSEVVIIGKGVDEGEFQRSFAKL